jgi:hypothetical protein
LEAKCADISASLRQKSDEAFQLLREKDVLRSEVQDLRERLWVTALHLQRFKCLQSLSTLLMTDTPSVSEFSGSAPISPSEEHASDEVFRCPDALLLEPRVKPYSAASKDPTPNSIYNDNF